jgi:ubiquinone/menaquinone biosynthesis C-methylase UbiE
MLTLNEWHARYSQQAGWSGHLRSYLNQKYGLLESKSILDIGCGTGVLEAEYAAQITGTVVGVDISYPHARYAARTVPGAEIAAADGYSLPFKSNSFDLVFCHYLLLWLKEPGKVLAEMLRVAKPGGYVTAFAEPDHAGRIDWPDVLVEAGKKQTGALAAQGVDPLAGRKLAGWFADSGLQVLESGLMGGQWTPSEQRGEADLEMQVLADDLAEGELGKWMDADRQARLSGNRVLFVPVFYAIGQKYSPRSSQRSQREWRTENRAERPATSNQKTATRDQELVIGNYEINSL